MAEQEQDSGEKEFDASEQRLRDARKDGDVPQSKEANAFALILGILIAALILDAVVGPKLFDDFSRILYHGDAFAADIFEGDGGATWAWIATTLLALSPLLLVMAALVLVALIIQQSIAFSAKKIMPDMKKINPVDNIKNKYGTKGLTDFLKDTVKMLFAAGLGTLFLVQFTRDYYGSSSVDTADFYQFTFNQTLRLILYFFAFQFVLAALDLPLQWRIHSHKLRMTREDMKKEMKQSEGDPHMRQQRREKATKISRGQMLQNVKSATVVMVNPTHYAVALKWDPDSKLAPVCVAKGTDHLAMKIRELAIENNVPIYSDPPATRSIYSMVEVDQEIQAEHFAAVAAAIQFVDRLRGMT